MDTQYILTQCLSSNFGCSCWNNIMTSMVFSSLVFPLLLSLSVCPKCVLPTCVPECYRWTLNWTFLRALSCIRRGKNVIMQIPVLFIVRSFVVFVQLNKMVAYCNVPSPSAVSYWTCLAFNCSAISKTSILKKKYLFFFENKIKIKIIEKITKYHVSIASYMILQLESATGSFLPLPLETVCICKRRMAPAG